MKSRLVLFVVLICSLLAMPAQAKRAPSHHKKHHKITRVNLREAPHHHAVHHNPPILAHFAASAPLAPRSPDPSPRAITSLPLPPDEAPTPVPTPVAVAPAPTRQPASAIIAAALTPKSVPKIHPIILPAPPTTPAVLVASGTVRTGTSTANADEPTPFTRVRLPLSRPTPAAKPAPVVKAVVAPAPQPAPKPYVLPGHALPLDEELTLISNLNQTHHRRRIPRFFGWIGREVARPFKFLFGEPEY